MESETREFDTATVLTAATGLWFGRSFDDLHQLLDFVLTDTLMTHQLGNAGLAAAPHLRKQFPWVEDLPPVPDGELQIQTWVRDVVEAHGATLQVSPAVGADWRRFNALADLSDMAPDMPVIYLEVPDADPR